MTEIVIIAAFSENNVIGGDAFFPGVDWSQWEEIGRKDRDDFSFVTYVRT